MFLSLFLTIRASAADAPVTSAAIITNAIPGTPAVAVPVTATGFTNIGQFTLTLVFDTTRVRFISGSSNAALAGMTITYQPSVSNTQGKLIMTWTGSSNISLSTGEPLANLVFSYISGSGILSWAYNYGSVCQYRRFSGPSLILLNDDPKYQFYLNGGIADRTAPVTRAPVVAMTSAGPVSVPLTVNDFDGIGALTLYLAYNPAVLTYLNTFSRNPAFVDNFEVGSVPGPSGMMLTIIQWFGSPLSLADGSVLCTLEFIYTPAPGVPASLNWYDTGPTCEYRDGASPLIDMPTSGYYLNGMVGPPVITNFTVSNSAPPKNVPVQFTDLSAGGATTWTWSFNRPGAVFVNGTGPASQNPVVQFAEGGAYTVTLVAANDFFTDSEIKTDYVRAGLSGLWTGAISTGWHTPQNWDDEMVPGMQTMVTIPSSAPRWPVVEGDLTIGADCAKLTLSGSTSEMTVNGDLIIAN